MGEEATVGDDCPESLFAAALRKQECEPQSSSGNHQEVSLPPGHMVNLTDPPPPETPVAPQAGCVVALVDSEDEMESF